jgi:hypothetical protein
MVVLLVKVPESANTGAAFPHLLPFPELPPAHSDSNYQTRGQTPPNTLPSIRSVLDLRSLARGRLPHLPI